MFVVFNVILVYNKKGGLLVDGIVIILFYNLLEDGGIKYNLLNGGLVDINVIKVVEDCVNVLLVDGLKGVKCIFFDEVMVFGYVKE